jgi:hypothetical protein
MKRIFYKLIIVNAIKEQQQMIKEQNEKINQLIARLNNANIP